MYDLAYLGFITNEKMVLVNIKASIYRIPFRCTVAILKMSKKMIFMAPGYKKALFKTNFN